MIKEFQIQTNTMADEFFDTEHLKTDLKRRSVRGGAVTMTAQIAKFMLQTSSLVVLARLLTPQDYGLVAMVTVITGFVTLFKDMGLSMATIQKAEVNHLQVSTLFWINLAVSIMLALLLVAIAPMISWFYTEPRLTYITLILAGTFIFSGLTVQHQALLRRQMRFSTIAAIEIGSMVAGVIAGVALAFYGAGYWALVGISIATEVSNAVLVWILCKWRPGLPVRGAGVLSMIAFGGHTTGFSVVNYFARNFDNILIGRFCGASVLGLYSRAYNLFMLPIAQIRAPLTAVALPTLSRLQNDPDKFVKYYCKFVSVLSFITMPLAGFLFVCSDNIIHILLGDRWMSVSPIFKILAVASFIQAVETTRGLVILSSGQGKRYFTYGLLRSFFLVGSFAIGIPWGAKGVAAGFTIGDYLILFPSLWYCFQGTSVSVSAFLHAIVRPAIAGLIATAIMFLIYKSFLHEMNDFVVIGGCLFVGLLSYLGAWLAMPDGLALLREFYSYIRLIFNTKNKS